MAKLSEYVQVEGEEYRLNPPTGEDGIYAAVPFHTEEQLIWYPPEAIETATKHDTWKRVLVGVAGETEELQAEVYLNHIAGDNLALMRFMDRYQSVGAVSGIYAAEDLVEEIVVSGDWRAKEMHQWLADLLTDGIRGGLSDW